MGMSFVIRSTELRNEAGYFRSNCPCDETAGRAGAPARTLRRHQSRKESGHGKQACSTQPTISPWSPFRHAAFTLLWAATVVANIGSWMSSAASGWLMTSLDPDPFIVSMVQVATTLPMFLFALPAGALADIVDRRKLLILVEIAVTAVSAAYAAIVSFGLATPGNLLLFTFLIRAAGALEAPAR